MDGFVSELKRKLEDEKLSPEQKISLLSGGLNEALKSAALQTDGAVLTRLKSGLFDSGVLSRCVLFLDPKRLGGNWSTASTLAQLLSSCCVGVEPGDRSNAFHRLFLPSVTDGLLTLAGQLMKRTECMPLFRKVMDSVAWLLRAHPQLTTQVLSSVHYEQIQMSDDSTVSLLCVQLWTHTCSTSRDFVSGLPDDSVTLLLNDAVSRIAVSSDAAVGGASIRLILILADQLGARLHPLLLTFKGLDSLLNKDWRGRGFDQEVEQLIKIIQSNESMECTERVRAACVIQAAWRSHQTRRRVKSLNRAVSHLQRKYRARRKQQQQQQEAKLWEEELKYQVCLRRQQARRNFHLKQRQLLQLLPPDQVQCYLQECERRAAVVIQSHWRGFRERRHYRETQDELKRTQTEHRAAVTIQRAVRLFLDRHGAAKATHCSFWIGQKGLTDGRRAELKKQVEAYVALHRSSRVSRDECRRLHEEVQLLLASELQRGAQRRQQEQRIHTLLAHTHTQLELLREAPSLSVVSEADADSFFSPSAPVTARARDSHNALLQAERLPWWRTLGNEVPGHAHLEDLEAELGGGLYVVSQN